MCKTSLESPFSLGPVGLKPDGGSGLLVLAIGLWPSFPGRGGDDGIVEMKILGWVSLKPSQRQRLGAESPFGRSQKTGAREWGSDTRIRELPHSTSKGSTEGLWDWAPEW